MTEDEEERFGLEWRGKRRAREVALAPLGAGILRPCLEDSVDWDATGNLIIEGDNLGVLKLLQHSHAERVRLIYIDPPYNSGEDFVYSDDFVDSSNWLNFMYPRLWLARGLLRPDGVIFVSIDDQEVAHLRLVCDEIFGVANFIAELVWEGANKNDARQVGVSHEYVLIYAKQRDALPREWSIKKQGVRSVLLEIDRLKTLHGDDFDTASEELAGWFRSMKGKPEFGLRRFRYIDARGAYKEDDPTAPGGRRFELRDPRTGNAIPLRKNRGWCFDQMQFNRLVEEGRISFVGDSSVMVRRYLHETDAQTPPSVLYQPARSASERLTKLMGSNVFNFPKDEVVLQKFIEMATDSADRECVVLDFFAGSGTTGHAVLAQNIADGGSRRYILVQLPETLDPDVRSQAAAAEYCRRHGKPMHLAELTKERLRRAAATLQVEHSGVVGDYGFRVYKLDSSGA
jgi:adenine-specific DNA-methyltransferase